MANTIGAVPSGSSVSPCCCGGSCLFTLPPPVGGTPYATLADATAAINNQTASCKGYVNLQAGGLLTSFTATTGTNSLTLNVVGNPDNAPSCQAHVWASFILKASSTLTIATTTIGTQLGGSYELFDSTGTSLGTTTGVGTQTISITSDGTYELSAIVTTNTPGFGGGSDTFNIPMSSNNTMTICTIRAAYGAGPSYLVCV